MGQEFIAHVRRAPDEAGWFKHSLEDHLRSVGRLAAEFAASFGGGGWAGLAGLWHDLGKYSPDFQNYIRKASGYEPEEAHLEGVPGRVDHSTAGALLAIEKFELRGRILAYLIAGHHAGLPDWDTSEEAGGALLTRVQQTDLLGQVGNSLCLWISLNRTNRREKSSTIRPPSSLCPGVGHFARGLTEIDNLG